MTTERNPYIKHPYVTLIDIVRLLLDNINCDPDIKDNVNIYCTM